MVGQEYTAMGFKPTFMKPGMHLGWGIRDLTIALLLTGLTIFIKMIHGSGQ